jgi:hypothetical protein
MLPITSTPALQDYCKRLHFQQQAVIDRGASAALSMIPTFDCDCPVRVCENFANAVFQDLMGVGRDVLGSPQTCFGGRWWY